jgi:hypothetical protein
MTLRVTQEDVELFRRDLWKDERTFPPHISSDVFTKDCFTESAARREFAILELLLDEGGEPLAPRPVSQSGSRLGMEAVDGMRLFEMLRALKELERRYRDGMANHAWTILLARQRQRLARIQLVLAANVEKIAPTPYPLKEKLESLLLLLSRVLEVRVDPAVLVEIQAFGEYWSQSCCQIAFRDATPKNTIVIAPGLQRTARPSTGEGDVECVDRLLHSSETSLWEMIPLMDVDFASAEHLTTFEDDPVSLHFHEWTFGSCPLEPTSLLLLPTQERSDPYRTAATFLVRYLRFGGRKLAYQLINSQGFEIRFRYDDPLFYFQRLGGLLRRLSEPFCFDFPALLSLVDSIGHAAASPTMADRQLRRVDHFRAVYGYGGQYWPENPRELT